MRPNPENIESEDHDVTPVGEEPSDQHVESEPGSPETIETPTEETGEVVSFPSGDASDLLPPVSTMEFPNTDMGEKMRQAFERHEEKRKEDPVYAEQRTTGEEVGAAVGEAYAKKIEQARKDFKNEPEAEELSIEEKERKLDYLRMQQDSAARIATGGKVNEKTARNHHFAAKAFAKQHKELADELLHNPDHRPTPETLQYAHRDKREDPKPVYKNPNNETLTLRKDSPPEESVVEYDDLLLRDEEAIATKMSASQENQEGIDESSESESTPEDNVIYAANKFSEAERVKHIEEMPTSTADEVYKKHNAIQEMEAESEALERGLTEARDKWQQKQVAKDLYHEQIPDEDLNMGTKIELEDAASKAANDVEVEEMSREEFEKKHPNLVKRRTIEDGEFTETQDPSEPNAADASENEKIADFPEGSAGIEVHEDVEHVVLETPLRLETPEEEAKRLGKKYPEHEELRLETPEEEAARLGVKPPDPTQKVEKPSATVDPGSSAEQEPKNVLKKLDSLEGTAVYASLGISPEDLASIDGFNDLSLGQRSLVANGLKHMTLERVRNEATDKQLELASQGGRGRRMWEYLRKNYMVEKFKKESLKNLESGGLEMHGDVLRELVHQASNGLAVEKLPDGSMRFEFIPQFENLTSTQMEQVSAFNDAANGFANIPESWIDEEADDQQKEAYALAKIRYEEAKENVINLELEKTEKNEKAVLDLITGIDGKVKMTRFMNGHPEIEEELSKIKDRTLFRNALNTTIAENGSFMAYGIAARGIAVGGLALAGAPLVAVGAGTMATAGIIGGIRTKMRTEQGFAEQDTRTRRGIESETETEKTFSEPEKLIQNLERNIRQLEEAENDESRTKRAQRLANRVSVTKRKLTQKEIVLGEGTTKIRNTSNIGHILGQADAVLRLNESPKAREEVLKRHEQFVSHLDQDVDEARKTRVLRNMMIGGSVAAGVAGAGFLAHQIADIYGWGDSNAETTPGNTTDIQEVTPPSESVVPASETPEATESTPETVPIPPISFEHEIQSGDKLWNILGKKLEEQMYTEGMNDVEKTHFIDAIKDRFASLSDEELIGMGFTPDENGHVDINMLEIGKKLDLSKVLSDTEFMDEAMQRTTTLSDEARASIAENLANSKSVPEIETTAKTTTEISSEPPPRDTTPTEAPEPTEKPSVEEGRNPIIEELERETIEKALREQSSTDQTIAEDPYPNIRVVNLEQQVQTPDYGARAAEIANTPIPERMLTDQELMQLRSGPQYKEMEREIEEIFNATPQERQAEFSADRAQAQEEAARSRAQRRGGERVIRTIRRQLEPRDQAKFDTARNILIGNRPLRPNVPLETSDAYTDRMYEWTGSPKTGPGIRDMDVNKVLETTFARPQGRTNLIEYQNRFELQKYVTELTKITKPLPGETTESFILRAKGIMDGTFA